MIGTLWLGMMDSNHRMPESKSGALPTWRIPNSAINICNNPNLYNANLDTMVDSHNTVYGNILDHTSDHNTGNINFDIDIDTFFCS
jgi:hypothetical protein